MVREEHIATAWPAHEDGDHVTFDPLTIADHGEPLASWDNNVILELYKEGELADVVIRARDFANGASWVSKEVHSFVLALASPVLRRMINWEKQRTISSDGSHRKKDSSGLVLEFGEEDHRVVAALCDFIYTGETQVFGGPQQLVALCKLADQLDVQRLREAVVEAARQSLAVSTCALMLQACRHAGVPELEEACMQFALKNFEEVSQTAPFLDLHAEYLASMLADDRLQASSEAVVYEALVMWMTGGRPGRRLSALSQLDPPALWSMPVELTEGGEGGGAGGAHQAQHADLCAAPSAQSSRSSEADEDEDEDEMAEGGVLKSDLLDCIRFGLLRDEYLKARVLEDARRWGCGEMEAKAEKALRMDPAARNGISSRSGSGPDEAAVQRYRVRHVAKDHAGCVAALAVYGHVIVSGSRDGSIRLFDIASGRTLGSLVRAPRSQDDGVGVELELGSVYALLVRGDMLFCGSQFRGEGPLNAFDLKSRRYKGRMVGHQDAVMSLVAKADSLYSGSWDTTIREWSFQRMECLRVVQLANSTPVVSMVCCNDALVVSSGTMGSTQVHAVRHHGSQAVAAYALPPDLVSHAACSAVGIGPGPGTDSASGIFRPNARFYTGHKDGHIRVWETDSWACVAAIRAHKDCVTALEAWGAYLVSGSVDCTVRLWDLSSANLSGIGDAEDGPGTGTGIGMGAGRALCAKVIHVQSEVASLVVCDGQIVIGSKDRSMRVIDSSGH